MFEKTKMALHSNVQEEENHQEQGGYSERNCGYDASTWKKKKKEKKTKDKIFKEFDWCGYI